MTIDIATKAEKKFIGFDSHPIVAKYQNKTNMF